MRIEKRRESDPSALEPFGQALLAYWGGDKSAMLVHELKSRRKKAIPVSNFFRDPSGFFQTEKACPFCRGRILVVGAGTGVHAVELERTGFEVTAIDVCPQAVRIMKERRLKDARHADFFQFEGESYDTILMLGQNIGIAETVDGLSRFFRKCENLLRPHGQMLANSVDESCRLGAAVQRDGYPGELEFRLCHEDRCGPWMRWLHVDYETLTARAGECGWSIEKLADSGDGAFLARLQPTLEIARQRSPGDG